MAKDTDPGLQKQIIYSVYLRAHTEEGTFRALIPDLDRIKALGTDIVWLMPIHPIGVKGKKGSLGCPYANRDYRATNPAYGTMADFEALCDAVHERGMKIMIDVVYNHTSPDSVLLAQHPEFFWRDAEGDVGNKIGDWADVIDLDYRNPGLSKVRHLDLGHNSYLGNLDFCAYMPNLETLIIALSDVSDLRPLANCPHLTYAELQTSALNDLRPLSGLTELKYLNICYNFSITDITPLYSLTQLKRLWIGCLDPVPAEQVARMKELAPDCQINTEDLDPTREEWRWDGVYDNGALKPSEAYEKLRVDMQYDNAPYSYAYIRNDPLYMPHGQGDNVTPPEWFTTQVPIPVDYTVY